MRSLQLTLLQKEVRLLLSVPMKNLLHQVSHGEPGSSGKGTNRYKTTKHFIFWGEAGFYGSAEIVCESIAKQNHLTSNSQLGLWPSGCLGRRRCSWNGSASGGSTEHKLWRCVPLSGRLWWWTKALVWLSGNPQAVGASSSQLRWHTRASCRSSNWKGALHLRCHQAHQRGTFSWNWRAWYSNVNPEGGNCVLSASVDNLTWGQLL